MTARASRSTNKPPKSAPPTTSHDSDKLPSFADVAKPSSSNLPPKSFKSSPSSVEATNVKFDRLFAAANDQIQTLTSKMGDHDSILHDMRSMLVSLTADMTKSQDQKLPTVKSVDTSNPYHVFTQFSDTEDDSSSTSIIRDPEQDPKPKTADGNEDTPHQANLSSNPKSERYSSTYTYALA